MPLEGISGKNKVCRIIPFNILNEVKQEPQEEKKLDFFQWIINWIRSFFK